MSEANTPRDSFWGIIVQSDMTEGRGPMNPTSEVYATEQDAWDAINHRSGVQGSHPKDFRPPGRQPAPTWQAYKALGGYPDWDVFEIPRVNPEWLRAIAQLEQSPSVGE